MRLGGFSLGCKQRKHPFKHKDSFFYAPYFEPRGGYRQQSESYLWASGSNVLLFTTLMSEIHREAVNRLAWILFNNDENSFFVFRAYEGDVCMIGRNKVSSSSQGASAKSEERKKAMQRIVWAVDPFEKPESLRQNAIKVLKLLNSRTNIEIDPVFVLRPRGDQSFDFEGARLRDLEYEAVCILEELKREYQLPISDPHVIILPRASLAEAVLEVCTYAQERRADSIMVNTHAKKGVKRLFLGSFAESLLLHSSIPVLTVNPNARHVRPFMNILVPTDFDKESHAAFVEAVKIAKRFWAKITLLHVIPFPIEPYYRGNVFYLKRYESTVREFVEKERRDAEHHAKAWKKWAHSQEVKVEFVMVSEGGSVAEHILNVARERRASVIAMETRKGPMEAAVLGSATRQVTRSAHCPVWVIRSRFAEQEEFERQSDLDHIVGPAVVSTAVRRGRPRFE